MAKIPTIKPPARGVLPSAMGFKNCVFVNVGESIKAKYDWLKSSDRDTVMGDATAENRRTLILTAGAYDIGATTVTLDEEYVDICSLTPSNPEAVFVYSSSVIHVFTQTCADIQLSGFTLRGADGGNYPSVGLNISVADNSASYYIFMHFKVGATVGREYGWPVLATECDLGGTWIHCKADNYAWRIRTAAPPQYDVKGIFWYCKSGGGAGDNSFGGDQAADLSGTFMHCEAGNNSFGGCGAVGSPCSGNFYSCKSGDNSFGVGKIFSGNAYYCEGGDYCFGGNNSGTAGIFSGYAVGCTATKGSFGGSDHVLSANRKLSGELVDCKCTGMEEPIRCEGATIRNCRITVTVADKHCIGLFDDNTKIYNSDLIVVQGSTGIPVVTIGVAARNVVVAHCRMNNATNDADGMGDSNCNGNGADDVVTNLVAGANVVDDDIT